MTHRQLANIALVASVLFGAIIAILAVTDSPALGTVAAIGGILLGVMWVVIGVVRRKRAA
jgi:hypothetical protein